jgi:hypothetical protein
MLDRNSPLFLKARGCFANTNMITSATRLEIFDPVRYMNTSGIIQHAQNNTAGEINPFILLCFGLGLHLASAVNALE